MIWDKVAAALGALALLLLVWGMWERSEAIKAEAQRDIEHAQVEHLSQAVNACNAGVAAAKQASDRAAKLGDSLLTAMRQKNKPLLDSVSRLEALVKNKPPTNCDDAWSAIELNAAAGSRR